jgi:hypothetical protein
MKRNSYHEKISTPFFADNLDVLGQPKGNNVLQKFSHKLKKGPGRLHHSWAFWVFLFLMLAAIGYYIMSDNFAFAPRKNMKQQSENSRTR